MSKKGHTDALSVDIRRARHRDKAVAQLRDLIDCMEFYYENRADYTEAEIAKLEKAVANQRVKVQSLTV